MRVVVGKIIMKNILISLFALSLLISVAYPENNNKTIPQIGLLGYKLNETILIKGITTEKRPNKKYFSNTIQILAVNDKDLETPVQLHIKNVNTDTLEDRTICIFKGFQSGEWVGCETCTSPRQFLHYFVVTEIIAPGNIKIEKYTYNK
jgi:hypothetical protein